MELDFINDLYDFRNNKEEIESSESSFSDTDEELDYDDVINKLNDHL